MFNPWEGWPVTCDWACHLAAHNSDLGTDFGCRVGTPIVAAFDGTLSNGIRSEPSPFRSLYIAILRSDANPSLSFEHMHLSRFATPGHYRQGDVIGWSGGARFALGSGQATGPHLHVNAIINGRLASIFTAFTEFASSNVKPISNTRRRDIMDLIRVSSTDNSYTEAILTDYVHTQVISPEFARNVMYCRADITDKVNGFDAVVAQSNYAALKALPSFAAPGVDQSGIVAAVTAAVQGALGDLVSDADLATALQAAQAAIVAKLPTKITGTLG